MSTTKLPEADKFPPSKSGIPKPKHLQLEDIQNLEFTEHIALLSCWDEIRILRSCS
jgi:hypothetical protein